MPCLEAAKGMGASATDLEKLAESTDLRTTDDILKQILTVLSEGGKSGEILKNQRGFVEGAKESAMFKPGEQPRFIINLDESALKKVGASALGIDTAKVTFNNISTKLLTAEKVTMTSVEADTTAKSTGDLVSMPGTSDRVLTGPFGAFSLDDRDMIMAGDPKKMAGGGSSPDSNFMAAAAMIVAAINTQTAQLKQNPTFGSGLTGQYYA
jgi:hypothetical protein